jgi:hypothetical protein
MGVINIVSVGPAEVKQSKTGKSYSQVEVFYKDEDGKPRSKKIMSFSRDIYPTVSKASPGEAYSVTSEKKGDFWEWTSINKANGSSAASATPSLLDPGQRVVQRSFPTSDHKDAQIARAVALKGAIEYLATCASGKADKSLQAVLDTAASMEVYLMQGAEGVAKAALAAEAKQAKVGVVAAGDGDFDDDIPFE